MKLIIKAKRSSKGILATFELVSAVLRYGSNQLFCHKNSLALVASSLTISLFFPESMNPEHYGIWVHVAEFAFPVALILEAFVLVQNAMVHVVKPEEPAANRTQRALNYLKGRGFSELQAKVTLDLACGYDTRQVATRNTTTVSTVLSYKTRSLTALGVSSMNGLKDLLSRDAGFSPCMSIDKVSYITVQSPQKE